MDTVATEARPISTPEIQLTVDPGSTNLRSEPPSEQPSAGNKRQIIGSLVSFLAIALIVLWDFSHLKRLFVEMVLPYAQPLGTALLALLVMRFKDWTNYKTHKIRIGIMLLVVLFAGFTIYNQYNERKERTSNTGTINNLVQNVNATRQEMKQDATTTTQSLTTIAGDLEDFKDKVRPDDLRAQMATMKTELTKTQKAMKPPPPVDLIFSFFPFSNPPVGQDVVPSRDVDLPVAADGSVHVDFTVLNLTTLAAIDGELSLQICDSCKFAKEPDRSRHLEGQDERHRTFTFERILPKTVLATFSADIIVPKYVNDVKISLLPMCRNCTVNEPTIGTVHLIQSR